MCVSMSVDFSLGFTVPLYPTYIYGEQTVSTRRLPDIYVGLMLVGYSSEEYLLFSSWNGKMREELLSRRWADESHVELLL